MNRISKFLAVITMAVFLGVSTFLTPAKANGEPKEINYIINPSLVLTYDGKDITSDLDVELEADKSFKFSFGWELDQDQLINGGDYSMIKVPSIFKLANPNEDRVIKDEDGIILTWEFIETSEGTFLKWVYHEEYATRTEDRNGKFDMTLKFDPEYFEEDLRYPVIYEDQNINFTIKAKPGASAGNTVTKTGAPDSDTNAKFIDWEIYLNKHHENLFGANIVDMIPEGLVLDESSIVIDEVSVGYNPNGPGKITTVEEDVKLPYSISGQELNVELGDTTNAYRLKYRTKINTFKPEGYLNTVNLNSKIDGVDKTSSASAEVIPVQGEALIKNGKVSADNKSIDWSLDVNTLEAQLTNITIEDTLPNNVKKPELITAYKMKKVGSQFVPTEEVIGTFNEFPINFDSLNEPVHIKYNTEIIEPEVYEKETVYKNYAKVKDADDNTIGEIGKEVKLTRDHLISKTGVERKGNDDALYFDWTIVVNKEKFNLKNITVKDTLPQGMELVENSIKVYEGDVENTQIKGVSTATGFEVYFGDISETYTIKYSTKVTAGHEGITSFENIAELIGDNVGVNHGNGKYSAPNTKDNVYSKGSLPKNEDMPGVTIDYEKKVMGWEVKIDVKQYDITNAIIEDNFIDKEGGEVNGLLFLKEELKVYKNGVKMPKEAYTLEVTDPTKGFKIEFKDTLEKGNIYTVHYLTSFDEDFIVKSGGEINANNIYANKVNISGKTNGGALSREDSVDRDYSYTLKNEIFNAGNKNGSLDKDSRTIDWTVNINTKEKNHTGNEYTVVDMLSQGAVAGVVSQVLIEDIKIYENTISSKGDIIANDVAISLEEIDAKVEYSKDKEGNTLGFTLTFNKGISKSYQIAYSSKLKGIALEAYSNSVKTSESVNNYIAKVPYAQHDSFVDKNATSVNGKYVYKDDEIQWEVKLNTGGSEILDAKFIDEISEGHIFLESNKPVVLLGGETLDESKYDVTIKKNVQVDNGDGTSKKVTQITFGFKETITKELIIKYSTVVVQSGGSISNKATLFGEGIEQGVSKEPSYEVEMGSDNSANGSVGKKNLSIIKTDELGNVLINNAAEFDLFYELNGDWIPYKDQSYLTESGKIELKNLPLRKYKLVEKTSPIGFEILTEPLYFELTKDQEKDVEMPVANSHQRKNLEVNKIWENGEFIEKEPVTITLYADGLYYDEIILDGTEVTPWTAEFKGLPLTTNGGQTIEYTIDELTVQGNFTKTVSNDTYSITNTYSSPLTSLTAHKEWIGGPVEKPTIEIQLRRNGQPHLESIFLENGETSYVWENLELTDPSGQAYHYEVVELTELDDYSKKEEGLTIVNTYVPEKTELTMNKIWVDAPTIKPDISIQLYRDGEAFGDVVVLKDGQTSYTWENIDLHNINLEAHEYSIDEVNVPKDYIKEVDGFTITNTFIGTVPKLPTTGSPSLLPIAVVFGALSLMLYIVDKHRNKIEI